MSKRNVFVVIGATLGLASGYGPVFLGIAGIFLKPMADTFNWNRADVSLLSTLAMVGVTICSPFVGRVADARGWNQVIAVSIFLFFVGLLAIAVAPASLAYIVVAGLFIGIGGAATTAVGYNSVIAHVFDRRLGLALGLAMTGSGIGSIIVPMLSGKLLTLMSWREACAVVAMGSLVIGLLAHQMIFRNSITKPALSNARHPGEKIASDKGAVTRGGGLADAIKNYRFWLIGITGTMISIMSVGAFVHMASHFSDRGFNPAMAAQFVGLYGLGLSLGRIAVGFIIDRMFAPGVAFAVFLFGGAGFLLLSLPAPQPLWVLSLAAILIGIAGGAEGDLIPFFVRKYFGLNAFGAIYGAMFACFTTGSALGPFLYGLSFDLLNSYVPIFTISAILSCICALLILTLGRYPRQSGLRPDQVPSTV